MRSTPGGATEERERQKMKLILLLAAMTLVVAGCTTTKLVQLPDGTTAEVHEVDERLAAGLASAQAANAVSAPWNPYSTETQIGLAAMAAIAAEVARRKNN